MWKVAQPARYDLPDVTQFIEQINSQADFFENGRPLYVGRASGRLDLMGGIADYSGSLVLELPLQVAALVAAQPSAAPVLTVRSESAPEWDGAPLVEIPLSDLLKCEDYPAARQLLNRDKAKSWAAYVIGALVVLRLERQLKLEQGVRWLISSDVPGGKGVSSSAALEVATMQSLGGLFGLDLEGRELALLCQKVENLVVGAPCGIMDQMTSACGEANQLLALLCQPAELQPPVALPPALEVWGIDSGVRHAVSGADYGSVRVGAFMGYRIIAEVAGFPVKAAREGRVTVEDVALNGYLANLAPSLWESQYREFVPVSLTGAEFLELYGGFTDNVTQIDPARLYQVRQPTAHPIYENQRVRLFRSLLQTAPLTEENRILLGELMYQSHASYSACGLGSDGTDRLVELVRKAGPAAGLYGAKITGGGSGGTVAVMARRGSQSAIQQIADQYRQETGHPIMLLSGSSPGALSFGILRLEQA